MGGLGKIIAATCFEKLPKLQYIVQPCHTATWSHAVLRYKVQVQKMVNDSAYLGIRYTKYSFDRA